MDVTILLDRALEFGKDARKAGLDFDPSANADFLSFFCDDEKYIHDIAKAYVLGWTLQDCECTE